jgi:transmembrane sensor
MNLLYEHMDDLIAKKLANEANAEEQRALTNWLAQSSDNKAYFDQLQRLWEISPQAKAVEPQFDTESALARVKGQIRPEMAIRKPRTTALFLRYAAAAAAIGAILMAVWWVHGPIGQPAPVMVSAPANEIKATSLPDGSSVTLNRNSGLTLQSGYGEKERRMTLKGEAYFEVAPNAERPFVVQVEELEVRALGTAFNIDANTRAEQIAISVERGKISLAALGQNLELAEGEQAIFDRAKGSLRKLDPQQQDPNATAYKNRVFQFDATPLRDVVAVLNKAYGSKIELEGAPLANCLLTGRYNNPSLERMLELLTDSFSIKYKQQPNGTILLSGSGCE